SGEETVRVDAVDQARVRWVDAVAEHAAGAGAELAGDVPARGEGEGLTGAEPGVAVVGGEGQVGRGRVRGAGVPEGAEEAGAGAGGAGRGCAGDAGCGGAAGGPAVAARPEGEGGAGVEGPQRGDGERGAGTGQRVVLVVVGRRAGGSAGADLDDLQLGEQEVGQQQPVDEGEHAGAVDEGVGGAGVVQHPVHAADAAGAAAVAAGGGEQRGEVVADAAAGGRGEQA